METLDGNKLIAEFMGLQTGAQLGYDRFLTDWFDNSGVINGQRNSTLLFDTSWDWLMPVISKCESIDSKRIREETGVRTLFTAKIDLAYEAVLQFIQWYNENK